jgi:hypothetical protein
MGRLGVSLSILVEQAVSGLEIPVFPRLVHAGVCTHVLAFLDLFEVLDRYF